MNPLAVVGVVVLAVVVFYALTGKPDYAENNHRERRP